MGNITIVTAFFDIGRNSWSKFQRPVDFYLESFSRLSKLNNQIIVYTSEDLREIVENISPNVTVIPYDFDEKSKATVLKANESQENMRRNNLVDPNLFGNPEYCVPEYVAVTSWKPKFVVDAISRNIIKNDLVAWIDFGYCREQDSVPSKSWSYDFDHKKIHIFSMSEIDHHRPIADVIYTGDVYIQGCHIVADKNGWTELESLMSGSLQDLFDQGLADDDQGILLLSYLKSPNRFEIHAGNPIEWFRIFKDYNLSI